MFIPWFSDVSPDNVGVLIAALPDYIRYTTKLFGRSSICVSIKAPWHAEEVYHAIGTELTGFCALERIAIPRVVPGIETSGFWQNGDDVRLDDRAMWQKVADFIEDTQVFRSASRIIIDNEGTVNRKGTDPPLGWSHGAYNVDRESVVAGLEPMRNISRPGDFWMYCPQIMPDDLDRLNRERDSVQLITHFVSALPGCKWLYGYGRPSMMTDPVQANHRMMMQRAAPNASIPIPIVGVPQGDPPDLNFHWWTPQTFQVVPSADGNMLAYVPNKYWTSVGEEFRGMLEVANA